SGLIIGIDVAATREVRLQSLIEFLEYHRLVGHVVRLEVTCDVQLGGSASYQAYSCSIELFGRPDVQGLSHHEALAVVIQDSYRGKPKRRISRHGPGCISRENVNFSGLESGETFPRGQRFEVDLARVPENGGSNRATIVNVKTGPLAFVIGTRETCKAWA